MKLYLHNFLQDNIETTRLYPLSIEATEVQEVEVEFNEELIDSFVKRIDLSALVGACRDLGIDFEAPDDITHMDEEQKRALHHILFEVEIISGELYYRPPDGSEPKRRFPIIAGIPDMCPFIDAEPEQPEQEEEEEEGE